MTPDQFFDSEAEEKPRRKRKKSKSKKDNTKTPKPYSSPGLGFHFTDAEERAMRRAIQYSKKFMETYGQAPAQPQTDHSHYINSTPPNYNV